MSKGGLYIWRVDKPHAFLGLPFVGRHFGYAGMTNSYKRRSEQHTKGSTVYGTMEASWSDLRPRCYQILPLPDHFLKSKHKWRRGMVKFLETGLIWVTCPVYNDAQQPPYNIRKISRAKAASQRGMRDGYGKWYKVLGCVIKWIIFAVIGSIIYFVSR